MLKQPQAGGRDRGLWRVGRLAWLVGLTLLALAPIGTAAAQQVRVDIERIGVANHPRPGDWAGIRLRLTDSWQTPREVILRVDGADPDGDMPWFETVVTTNPGLGRTVWTYLQLPPNFDRSFPINVRVYEAEGDGAAGDGIEGFQHGRLIGSQVTTAGTVVDPADGMIGVLGRASFGLSRYQSRLGTNNWSPLGHERVEIVTQMTPADLPDRFHGLAPFEAIVWGQGDPDELGSERAAALRDWVRRGGHLVVVLPRNAQIWETPQGNPLATLMPEVRLERHEDVDYALYRHLLSDDPNVRLPERGVVHELVPLEAAGERTAIRLIQDAEGRCVVARRLEGAGMVTMIGLHLEDSRLPAAGLPEADRFWHRIFGRRGELLSSSDVARRNQQQPLQHRREVWYDQDIPGQIAKTGRSAAGVLMGFVLFVVYWLVAGPLGFVALRRFGWQRHAWMLFFGTAVLFTLVAWSAAAALRPARVEGNHLTFVDHIYDQPVQRTRTWMSLLIPEYGSATVGFAETEGGAGLISAWAPHRPDGAGGGLGRGFPDARGYRIDARDPSRVTIPTRSTVKQLRTDWSGPPRPGWNMPRPVLPEGEEGTPRLRIRGLHAEGELVHELPGTLRDVVVVVNRGQIPLRGSPGRSLLSNAEAYKVTSWAPGDRLDLGRLSRATTRAESGLDRYLSGLVAAPAALGDIGRRETADPMSATQRLTAAAFFQLLPPPTFEQAGRQETLLRRNQTHGWDLSRWLTQPCVIVVGHLGVDEDGPTPTPLRLFGPGGESEFPTRGRTVVRWVYPLEENPPRAERPDE